MWLKIFETKCRMKLGIDLLIELLLILIAPSFGGFALDAT